MPLCRRHPYVKLKTIYQHVLWIYIYIMINDIYILIIHSWSSCISNKIVWYYFIYHTAAFWMICSKWQNTDITEINHNNTSIEKKSNIIYSIILAPGTTIHQDIHYIPGVSKVRCSKLEYFKTIVQCNNVIKLTMYSWRMKYWCYKSSQRVTLRMQILGVCC